MRLIIFISLIAFLNNSNCDEFYQKTNAKFLGEFMKFRKLNHLVILDEKIKSANGVKFLKRNYYSFSKHNLFLSMQSSLDNLQEIFSKGASKTFFTLFERSNNSDALIEQLNNITQYGGDNAGVIIFSASNRSNLINNLRFSTFGIDADILIVVPYNNSSDQSKMLAKITNSTTKPKISQEIILLSYPENDNSTNYNLEEFCEIQAEKQPSRYCLIQVYKVRKNCNTSLVIHPVGVWSPINSTWKEQTFLTIEQRTNFYEFPLIGGMRNTTINVMDAEVINDDIDDIDKLKDFYLYFITFLNSSESIKYYSKIGQKDTDGDWKDLLGAVVKEDVDIGIDNTIRSPERVEDMSFSQEIMKTMRNIYVRPEESNEIRDIFLQPFDKWLLLCVMGTGIVFAIVMTLNNNLVKIRDPSATQNVRFLDSLIWCIGIFTQQGSILRPKLFPGQMIVLLSLAFTLLIYNSYSAFITSVLSVELSNIRTVDDLLESDYDIGYAKNSKDEVYLRSTNFTQLNEIYLRGYLHNNISNITEGLLKASRGNYGFFASVQSARKQLLNISNYKCKYDIDEIPIRYTSDSIAFAMATRSPYKRLVNLSIIKMYETGIYKYILSLINPNLLRCEKAITYQSASLPELTTAFCLPLVGIALGVGVMVLECFWYKRRMVLTHFKRKCLHSKKKGKGYMGPVVPYAN